MSGRYVLPSFTERTSYGAKEVNPYNKLFEDRVVFLAAPIDDTLANDVMAQLLTLESLDPTATSASTSTRPADRSPR
ncbi:ATP-dependent Clp protease proteolytic subunit [[Actinomadura] parvosata subsp. kistnae]|nr:ATP-dependent Clp protease proteolytic subunit [Actinomadura parvosata subsp. kistnae]